MYCPVLDLYSLTSDFGALIQIEELKLPAVSNPFVHENCLVRTTLERRIDALPEIWESTWGRFA